MICFYHNDADGKCAGFWVDELAKREADDGLGSYSNNLKGISNKNKKVRA